MVTSPPSSSAPQPGRSTRQWIAYIGSLVLPFVCTWVTIRTPSFHTIPYTLHFACIAGLAALGGLGPALAGIVVSVVSFNYHLSAPYNQWSFTPPHFARAAALLAAAFFLIFISWQQRRTEARLRAALASLQWQTDALVRAEKLAAMGRLASTVAHEINNPLESVTNLLYLARTSDTLDDTTRSYLALAEEELARLANITRLTLSFVRTAAARTPVDIAAVLESVLGIFRRRSELLDLSIERHYTPGLRIDIYEHELRQIFTNLISTAIDALGGIGVGFGAGDAASPCRLRLQTFLRDNTVILHVEDNGRGIAEADQSRVFDAFFSTKSDTGTGIGLWVTRELVEKNAGHISVQSGNLPNGMKTCFRLELPATPQTPEPTPDSTSPEPESQPIS